MLDGRVALDTVLGADGLMDVAVDLTDNGGLGVLLGAGRRTLASDKLCEQVRTSERSTRNNCSGTSTSEWRFYLELVHELLPGRGDALAVTTPLQTSERQNREGTEPDMSLDPETR